MEISASTLYARIGRWVLFFVAAAASFSGYYQKWHFGEADMPGDHARASFESMVDGTAYRPYVYRQLIPTLANRMDQAVPAGMKSALLAQQSADAPFLYAISSSPTANKPEYFFRYVVVYGLTFLSAWLAVFAMHLVCGAVGVSRAAAVLAPVLVILLVPYIQSIGGFFYDYAELAFLALAVWIALKFEWWVLIPVAALGEGNKESFVLIVLTLYPLIRLRRSRVAALAAIAVLCGVCLAVYLPMRMRFAQNPGGTVELQWMDQLHFLAHPREFLFATEETYGVRMLRIYTVLPMALLVWTIWRAWKRLPLAMRRHALIAAAINIPLYLLFCYPGELRNLSMLYVVLLLCIAANLDDALEAREAATA